MQAWVGSADQVDALRELFGARGAPSPDVEMLPANGWIEPKVAAGFMYLTDSRLGIVEHVVTHPEATPEARHQALDMIIGNAHLLASEQNIRWLVAWFKDEGIASRAQRHGMRLGTEWRLGVKELV